VTKGKVLSTCDERKSGYSCQQVHPDSNRATDTFNCCTSNVMSLPDPLSKPLCGEKGLVKNNTFSCDNGTSGIYSLL